MLEEVLNNKAALTAYEEEIAAAEAKIADLKAALLDKVRAGIDDLIQGSGLTREEVIGAQEVTAQKGVTVTRETRTYALKADPTKLYSRGRLPGWLRDAMRASGYNPESPDSRTDFRADHMVEQAS